MFGCYAVAWETECAWGRRRPRRRRKRGRRRGRRGTERLSHSHTAAQPQSTRSLTPRCALFRSSRPPHCSPRTPGSPGWNSSLSRGGEKLGCGRGSEAGARAPPGAPLPHGTFGGCGLGHPRCEVGARPPVSRRRRPARGSPAVWGGAGRSQPWRGRCGGGCCGAAEGDPGAARGRASPRRPGREAFLLQPRGRGCDTEVRGSRVSAGLGPARPTRGCYLRRGWLWGNEPGRAAPRYQVDLNGRGKRMLPLLPGTSALELLG